jgi:hypothetical protein
VISVRDAIVLLAGLSEPAKEIREALAGWAAAGLAKPILWVQPEMAAAGDVDVNALLIDHQGEQDVRLLEILARRRFELLRVVTAHCLTSPAMDPSILEHSKSLGKMLTNVTGAGMRLERLNVIIPVADLEGLPPALTLDPDSKHILVSPADRRTERHMSRPVTHPGMYVAHAAAAILTVSGSWARMNSGPFDGHHFTESLERSQVAVARTFVRMLKAGRLTDRVTTEVFQRRRKEAWTAAAVEAVNAPSPQHLVNDVVTRMMEVDSGAMRFRPAPGTPAPRPQHVGIRQAFVMMLKFIVGKLRAVPSQIAERVSSHVRSAVENLAQSITFGQDSTMQVAFGGRARGGPAEATPTSEVVDFASQLLRDMGRSASPPSSASVWQALRGACYGLVDAGPFPEGFPPPTDGARRLVINDVGVIVGDPLEPFVLNRGALGPAAQIPEWAYGAVRPWEAQRARELHQLLAEQQRLAEHGQGPATDEHGQAIAAVEPNEDLAERLRVAILQLKQFVGRHRPSLLWQVSENLDAQQREAARSFADALRTVRAGEPRENEEAKKKASRWLRRWWIIAFLVAATPPLVALWLEREEYYEVPNWWALIGISTAIWLVWWFIAFLRYQRRMFQIQYEIDRKHRAYLDAIRRAENDAFELVRLASMYDQLADWSAVIAWMTHHPEGTLDEVEEPPPLHLGDLPLSMRIAEGRASSASLQRTSAVVGRSVFGRGWLGNLYQRYESASMGDLKHQLGLPAEAPNPGPDRDLADPSPRGFLREQIEAGEHAPEWCGSVYQLVDAELGTIPPDELFAEVVPLAESGAGEADEMMTPESFLAEASPSADPGTFLLTLWNDEARLRGAEHIDRIHLWSPPTLVPSSHDRLTVHAQEESPSAQGIFALGAIRLDVARPCPATDLAMFDAAHGAHDAGGTTVKGDIG